MSLNPVPALTDKLLLASRSPRRRDLLQMAGYAFEVEEPSERAECGVCSAETPPELVARMALQKARDVAKRKTTRCLVLGCDTVAECCGQILGKPHDRAHAREMLRTLRGRIHHVYSGVCLWERPVDHVLVDVACSRLRMEEFSDELLNRYLDSDQWQDKAGAFGFQDGLDWVQLEEGSASNVVGLPLELLAQMMATMASHVFKEDRAHPGATDDSGRFA